MTLVIYRMLVKFAIALENGLSRHTNNIVRQNYQIDFNILM